MANLTHPAAAVRGLQAGDLADLLQLVGQPRGVRIAAFELQQVLGVGPALAFLADTICHRNPDVLEEHLVDLLVALGRTVQESPGVNGKGYMVGADGKPQLEYPGL